VCVVLCVHQHTDEAVAKHIVSVHRQQNEVLVGPYSTEDVQNYIRVARQIDPEMTPEAERAIVRCYVRLRSADAVGSSQQSYRITVRQLESLVRLSEAMARAHLKEKVTQEHVYAAFNLLKRSILTVDAPDVELSGEVGAATDVDMGEGEAGSSSGSDRASESSGGSASSSKPGMKLSHEAFQNIRTQLLFRLRELEEAGESPPEQQDLAEWFVEKNLARLSRDSSETVPEQAAKCVGRRRCCWCGVCGGGGGGLA